MTDRNAEPAALAKGARPMVSPIRKGVRVARRQRAEDDAVIRTHVLTRHWRTEMKRLEQTDPDSENHRAAIRIVDAMARLPRANLRCITSTLDEERDFELRCMELEILRAEHALRARNIDRLRILDHPGWKDAPTRTPMVTENNRLWDLIMATTIEMAETPVRNWPHLDLKRRLIGRIWLAATGDRYDRMRAGIAADEAWLAEHRPRRSRARLREASG